MIFSRAFYLSHGIFCLGGKFLGGGRLKFLGGRYHFSFFFLFRQRDQIVFHHFSSMAFMSQTIILSRV